MDTLIRIAEVWSPSADGTVLELAGGCYGAAPAFGVMSRRMCFGMAEGLPGRAWELGRPIVLTSLQLPWFRRAAAAAAAGVDSAVALPVYFRDRLSSVVVFLCAPSPQRRGAIELWHNDPRVTGDLRLDEGLFAADTTLLEDEARDGFLPRGAGLPGRAWQQAGVVMVPDLVSSRHFLRVQSAAAAGLVQGLAIPCAVRDEHTWVLNFLAAPTLPVARRVEVWIPDERGTLTRSVGHCERFGLLPLATTTASPQPVGLGEVMRSGRALAVESLAAPLEVPLVQAGWDGLRSALLLPVIAGDAVSEVVVLYF